MNNHNQGGTLLLLVIIISLITTIISLTFFTAITNYTKLNNYYIESEISYLKANELLKNHIGQHLAPAPFPVWPDFNQNNPYTSLSSINNTTYETIIQKDNSNNIIFEITASTNNIPRKLRAILTPPELITAESEIILLIDTSNSMNEIINSQSKLESAKTSTNAFIDAFSTTPNIKISIINYDTNIYTQRQLEPITENIDTIKTTINNLATNGSTNIGGALEKSNEIYTSQTLLNSPKRYIVLLTDGLPTVIKNANEEFIPCIDLPQNQQYQCLIDSSNYSLLQSTIAKNQNQTIIYTIGFGNSNNPNSIDPQLLRSIATNQEHYFETPNPDQLTIIFQNIAQAILRGGTIEYREVIP